MLELIRNGFLTEHKHGQSQLPNCFRWPRRNYVGSSVLKCDGDSPVLEKEQPAHGMQHPALEKEQQALQMQQPAHGLATQRQELCHC